MPEMPSLTTQAVNASGAIARALKALATGAPLALPVERVDARLLACQTCDLSIPKDVEVRKRRCQACGCHLDLKAAMATEVCPKGHW